MKLVHESKNLHTDNVYQTFQHDDPRAAKQDWTSVTQHIFFVTSSKSAGSYVIRHTVVSGGSSSTKEYSSEEIKLLNKVVEAMGEFLEVGQEMEEE